MKNSLKHLFRSPVSVTLLALLTMGMAGCGQSSAPQEEIVTQQTGPVDAIDVQLNDYEKLAKEYGRVARKHSNGDVSVTMLYIDLRRQTEASTAKLKQESAQMKVGQARRFAKISATVAPYLQ